VAAVTKKLRVALNNENLNSVKIHGPDHNHFMVTYYLSALWSDPELLEAIDGIAFHSYCEKNEACGGEIDPAVRLQLMPRSHFEV